MIKIKPLQLAEPQAIFKASDGWFARFLLRNNFELRRITNSGRG